jgi:hypothetical protein
MLGLYGKRRSGALLLAEEEGWEAACRRDPSSVLLVYEIMMMMRYNKERVVSIQRISTKTKRTGKTTRTVRPPTFNLLERARACGFCFCGHADDYCALCVCDLLWHNI